MARSLAQLSRPHDIGNKLPAKSSSLSNHSSCSQGLQHTLWSDQSCSTNDSSLPRVGTSPRTIIHPQPLRGMRSGLLQLRSPSPDQLGSLVAQKGSQTTIYEPVDVPTTETTSARPTRCSSRASYMSCEPEPPGSLERNKSHNYSDLRSETSCSPRISLDPACSSFSPASHSYTTHHRQRLPDLTHTSLRHTPSGPPRPPVTEAQACGEQTMTTTRGSTTRQPPPPATQTEADTEADTDTDTVDNHASLSLSPELPADVDPQELLDFLREFEQDRQRSKETVKTGPGPQASAIRLPGSRATHSRLSGETEEQQGHRKRKRLGGSMASDLAQPPQPPCSQKYPVQQHITSPDDRLQQTPALSANESTPSLVVHPPDSPPAMPKTESRYRPPDLFIGRLASGLPTNPRQGKKRRTSTTRPYIRALPNHSDDPIDEEM
ncbi:hypothetical protein E4U43_000988 [Claviceps pusilla]|uniref:Uncharacterized protein n=1 Tax=Claviceps pusilla TaxID=123648 RepID=A0A9P7NAK8_9HYPO|nr:hypothetical protein E4U43_000988 [Claviceps pusilla]